MGAAEVSAALLQTVPDNVDEAAGAESRCSVTLCFFAGTACRHDVVVWDDDAGIQAVRSAQ